MSSVSTTAAPSRKHEAAPTVGRGLQHRQAGPGHAVQTVLAPASRNPRRLRDLVRPRSAEIRRDARPAVGKPSRSARFLRRPHQRVRRLRRRDRRRCIGSSPGRSTSMSTRKLAAFAPPPYIVPSSGAVVIAAALQWFSDHAVALAGFTHQGSDCHPFSAERRFVDALVAAGRLHRVSPDEDLSSAGIGVGRQPGHGSRMMRGTGGAHRPQAGHPLWGDPACRPYRSLLTIRLRLAPADANPSRRTRDDAAGALTVCQSSAFTNAAFPLQEGDCARPRARSPLPPQNLVIPAKAGSRPASSAEDSRFRGNDGKGKVAVLKSSCKRDLFRIRSLEPTRAFHSPLPRGRG